MDQCKGRTEGGRAGILRERRRERERAVRGREEGLDGRGSDGGSG